MCYNTHESQEGLIKNCQNHNETAKPYALKKYKGEVKMQQKTKKLTSLILLFSLLISMFTLLSVAADTATAPTNDAEAIAAGYHAKYVEGGVTKYIKVKEDNAWGTRNTEFNAVPSGTIITLIDDITIGFELSLNANYTIDGNGKTLYAAFRTDSGSANVVVKNLTIETPELNTTGGNATNGYNNYFYQINAGNTCKFENCTINVNGTPQWGALVLRGNLTIENTTINYITAGSQNFFLPDASEQLTLNNVTFKMSHPTTGSTATGKWNLSACKIATVAGTIKIDDSVSFTVPGATDITNTADWAMPNVGITPAGGKEGFRVGTVVSKSWWDANKGVTVKEWGTMIDVASQVKDGDKFSLTMLKASGNKYATVANDGWFREDANADTLCFYGVLTGIASEKANTEFGGIGYITLTVPGLGEFTYYGNGAFFQNSAE